MRTQLKNINVLIIQNTIKLY